VIAVQVLTRSVVGLKLAHIRERSLTLPTPCTAALAACLSESASSQLETQ